MGTPDTWDLSSGYLAYLKKLHLVYLLTFVTTIDMLVRCTFTHLSMRVATLSLSSVGH